MEGEEEEGGRWLLRLGGKSGKSEGGRRGK